MDFLYEQVFYNPLIYHESLLFRCQIKLPSFSLMRIRDLLKDMLEIEVINQLLEINTCSHSLVNSILLLMELLLLHRNNQVDN